MAKIRVKGDTSGYIDIAAPDVAGAATVNLDKIPQTDQAAAFTSNITTTGNVGIGTTSPTAPLDISAGTTSGTMYNALVLRGGQNSTQGSGVRIWMTGTENDPLARGSIIESEMVDNGNSHALKFYTSVANTPTEKMRIDQFGRVTMPYQPMFRVALQNTQTSAGTVVFNSIRYQVGNHYNNSTGFFTAPVAGRYQFNLVWLTENNANEGNAELRKNNADIIFRTRCGRSSGHKTTTGTAVVDMVANDTASIYFDGGGSQFYGDANLFWTVFSGYLIG